MTTYVSRVEARSAVQRHASWLKPELHQTLLAIAGYYPNAWPSRETLAAELGVSIPTIRDRLRRLTELHVLDTEHKGARRQERPPRRFIRLPGLPAGSMHEYVAPRRCARCGCSIEHKRANARTCSERCRQALSRSVKTA